MKLGGEAKKHEEHICKMLIGQAILSIPNNSKLELVNTDTESQSLTPCSQLVNNAAINIIKLSE
jgi:hypothetical protein